MIDSAIQFLHFYWPIQCRLYNDSAKYIILSGGKGRESQIVIARKYLGTFGSVTMKKVTAVSCIMILLFLATLMNVDGLGPSKNGPSNVSQRVSP